MGFMAGFGSAFSRSFEQASDQRAQAEQDAFRLGYADYITNRDKRLEQKREDAKRMNAAENLAKQYSTPENTMIIYNMLLGQDVASVEKYLQDYEITIDPTAVTPDGSGPADPRAGLSQQAEGAVDAQMTQAGMQKPADKGIFGNMLGSRQDRMDRKITETQQRIADTSGVPLQEVQDTMKWTPEPIPNQPDLSYTVKPKTDSKRVEFSEITDLQDALLYMDQAYEDGTEEEQLRAERIVAQFRDEERRKTRDQKAIQGNLYEATRGVGTNPDGSKELVSVEYDKDGNVAYYKQNGEPFRGTVKEFNKDTEKGIDDTVARYNKPILEYNSKLTSVKDTIKVVDDIANLQKSFPDAATGGGSLAQIADKTARGLYGAINIFTDNMLREGEAQGGQVPYNEGFVAKLGSAEKALEGQLSGVAGNVNRNAVAAALMDIKATKLAYAMAAQVGQTGRSVSVQEFQAYKDAALGHGNPESSQINSSDFIASELAALQEQFNTLNTLIPENDAFKRRHGIDLPVQLAVDPEADIRSDKKRADMLDRILEKGQSNVLTNTPNQPGGSENVAPAPEGWDPEDWKYLDPADQQKVLNRKK